MTGSIIVTRKRFDPYRIGLGLLVVLAAVLRLSRLRLGLPDFLEEAIPLRLALQLKDVATGRIDWNPHAFNYPSLSVYLHFAVQQAIYMLGLLRGTYHNYADYVLAFYLDPSPMVIGARLVGILCDVLALVGVVRITRTLNLGRGAALLAAAIVALSPTLVTISSSIFCDSLMGVLAVWALERMLAWHASGRRSALIASAVLVGLASGAKYPAAALVIPLVFVLWSRDGRKSIAPACAALAIALGVFLLTTPFALLDSHAFLRDLSWEGRHAAGGHFGSVAHRSFAFHLLNLARNIGWAGLLLVLVSGVLVALKPAMRTGFIALWLCVLAFGVPIALARVDAERYLVPVILFAVPLAACALFAGLAGRAARFRWLVAAGAVALILVPVLMRTAAAVAGAGDTTQLEARRWCESHVGRDQLLVQEGYAARLPSFLQIQQLQAQPVYAHASQDARDRLDRMPSFHVVALPLRVSGSIEAVVRRPGRPQMRVVVLPHAEAINRVFYDPRLFTSVDYVMTSSAVRGRFTADPLRFPVECAFYRLLDSAADPVARFVARSGVVGPDIVVYRIGPRYAAAMQTRGSLDPLWWREAMPAVDFTRDTAWAQVLPLVYDQHIRGFVWEMSTELMVLGRYAGACTFASATLSMHPQDADAALLFGACAGKQDRWDEVLAVGARAMAARPRRDVEPGLVLLHARALNHLGQSAAARAELLGLISRVHSDNPVAAAARQTLASLSPAARRAPSPSPALSSN